MKSRKCAPDFLWRHSHHRSRIHATRFSLPSFMTSVNATKSPQPNPPRPRHPLNPFSIKPLVGFIVVCLSLYYSLNFLRLPNRNPIPALPEGEEMSRKKCIVYHTNWANYARNFQVKDIPLQGITDIAYAFFNLQDSGGGLYKIVSGDT
jgi:hypothetical protein